MLTDKKLQSEAITLLVRVGKYYQDASHPAVLVTAHADEIISLCHQAQEADTCKKIGGWLNGKARSYDVRFPTEFCVVITKEELERLKQGKLPEEVKE